jgi:hypothetical protein
MKRILFNLLAIFLWLGSCLIPAARGDPPLGCCVVIQLSTSQVQDCNANGRFEPVVVTPAESATVSLQYHISFAARPVVIQAFDGGTLGINGSTAIDQDGRLTFPYQCGEQPGFYRVSVVVDVGGNREAPGALVQFQVPNPQ